MVVNALDPTWINAPAGVGPSYDAEELRRAQGFTLASGVTPGSARTGVLNIRDLALSLSGTNVRAGAGGAVIGTAKGAYVSGLAVTTTIRAYTAADATNPRRDRIVLEILDPDNGGDAGRKAQLRVIDGTPHALAASGSGYPAEPVLAITLGYLDVPKVDGGNPALTAQPPITAAAGAPIPVRSQAEADALPKWVGLQVLRVDARGWVQSWDGSKWYAAAPFAEASGYATVPTVASASIGSVEFTFPVGLFTVPPIVSYTPESYRLTAATSAPTTEGATAVCQNNSNVSTGQPVRLHWTARQQTPTSAAG